MKINKTSTLKELQEQFSDKYEGLKIEFFRPAEEGYEGPYNLLHYSPDTQVSQVNPNVEEVEFGLYQDEIVEKFEGRFSALLGIDVQVFRRSKELWLQTTKTDKWTLDRQNTKGIHSLN